VNFVISDKKLKQFVKIYWINWSDSYTIRMSALAYSKIVGKSLRSTFVDFLTK